MKAPITGNSITECVRFTGVYVPDETGPREAEDARHESGGVRDGHAADDADVSRVA